MERVKLHGGRAWGRNRWIKPAYLLVDVEDAIVHVEVHSVRPGKAPLILSLSHEDYKSLEFAVLTAAQKLRHAKEYARTQPSSVEFDEYGPYEGEG